MTFRVETNVLSEATKPQSDAKVVAWLADNETQLAINPIILGELRVGILSLPKSKRRSSLLDWLDQAFDIWRVGFGFQNRRTLGAVAG